MLLKDILNFYKDDFYLKEVSEFGVALNKVIDSRYQIGGVLINRIEQDLFPKVLRTRFLVNVSDTVQLLEQPAKDLSSFLKKYSKNTEAMGMKKFFKESQIKGFISPFVLYKQHIEELATTYEEQILAENRFLSLKEYTTKLAILCSEDNAYTLDFSSFLLRKTTTQLITGATFELVDKRHVVDANTHLERYWGNAIYRKLNTCLSQHNFRADVFNPFKFHYDFTNSTEYTNDQIDNKISTAYKSAYVFNLKILKLALEAAYKKSYVEVVNKEKSEFDVLFQPTMNFSNYDDFMLYELLILQLKLSNEQASLLARHIFAQGEDTIKRSFRLEYRKIFGF